MDVPIVAGFIRFLVFTDFFILQNDDFVYGTFALGEVEVVAG